MALRNRDLDVLKIALGAGAAPKDATVPFIAAMRSQSDEGFLKGAANLLLHAKADPNHLYRKGKTILSMAAKYCHAEVVHSLLAPPTVKTAQEVL